MQVMLVEACRRQDVTGWWMSEKVNGVYTVRGDQCFLSRSCKTFNVPPGFIEGMPGGGILGGKLRVGRGVFRLNPKSTMEDCYV